MKSSVPGGIFRNESAPDGSNWFSAVSLSRPGPVVPIPVSVAKLPCEHQLPHRHLRLHRSCRRREYQLGSFTGRREPQPRTRASTGRHRNCAVAWVHRQLSRTYSGTAGATMAPVRRPIKGRSEGWLTIREGREIGTRQSPQSVRSAQGTRPTLLDGSGIPKRKLLYQWKLPEEQLSKLANARRWW
jgi:hypothetical protein